MKKIWILGMFLGLLSIACRENEMNDFDSEGSGAIWRTVWSTPLPGRQKTLILSNCR